VPCADDNSVLAQWFDGSRFISEATPGVALADSGRVVIMNMHPASSDSRQGGWPADSDTGLMLANALLYATEYQANCRAGGVLFLADQGLAQWEDIHTKIINTGRFNCSALLSVNASLPTIDVLARYGAVLVSVFNPFPGLQDLLSTYLQLGGGVVITAESIPFLPRISALVQINGTVPVPPGAQISLRILSPNSTLMQGVTDFTDASGRVYPNLQLKANATQIANIAVGNTQIPLVASIPQVSLPPAPNTSVPGVLPGGVVTLNFFAPSTDAFLRLPACPSVGGAGIARVSTAEGTTLIANALQSVFRVPATPPAPPQPVLLTRSMQRPQKFKDE
jgi:hypothetical protein